MKQSTTELNHVEFLLRVVLFRFVEIFKEYSLTYIIKLIIINKMISF